MEARSFVVKSAKLNNFSQAEHVFTQLCDMIRFRSRHSDNDNPSTAEKSVKEHALKLAEEGVSYGFALQQQQPDSFKEETPKVFESIITPVLDHFGLQLSYSKANIIKNQ
ncbi:hypothetical protein BC941DRAFT_518307 [Chlamydoabsidia padenii]|nr:hypothetical protein BC941DRAFT_518307 [Chlamydoabsidia padenii]